MQAYVSEPPSLFSRNTDFLFISILLLIFMLNSKNKLEMCPQLSLVHWNQLIYYDIYTFSTAFHSGVMPQTPNGPLKNLFLTRKYVCLLLYILAELFLVQCLRLHFYKVLCSYCPVMTFYIIVPSEHVLDMLWMKMLSSNRAHVSHEL